MKRILVFSCALLLVLGAAWSAQGGVVLEDDFDDGVLDPAWSITFENAADWVYDESGTELTVTDIDVGSQDEIQKVILSRTFSHLTDFYVDFEFSWDCEGNDLAYQNAYILLYDDSNNRIAFAGYQDPWWDSPGQILADIGSGLMAYPDFETGGYNPNFLAGSAFMGISRKTGEMDIYWNGESVVSETSTAGPLARIDVEFWFYFVPGQPNSFFGTESVGLIRVADTPVIADFSADTLLGLAPLEVVFTDESIGDIETWNWDFGDEQASTEQNPTHTYNTPGTYSVSLRGQIRKLRKIILPSLYLPPLSQVVSSLGIKHLQPRSF